MFPGAVSAQNSSLRLPGLSHRGLSHRRQQKRTLGRDAVVDTDAGGALW